MESLKVRHFILCTSAERRDEYNFTAVGIYEYFSAPDFPCKIDIEFVLGLCFAQPGEQYEISVTIYQDGILLGGWHPVPFELDKPIPNEVMTLHFRANQFPIPNEGLVEFRILVDNELVDTQYVDARREVK